jgi:hypothetical protein
LYSYLSLTLTLSRRERGKQCALFAGQVSYQTFPKLPKLLIPP